MSHEHRLHGERPSPCSSAFIHQSAWIPPPSPSWDPHRQEADQNWQADLPRRGASHSYVPMGMRGEKLEVGREFLGMQAETVMIRGGT